MNKAHKTELVRFCQLAIGQIFYWDGSKLPSSKTGYATWQCTGGAEWICNNVLDYVRVEVKS